MLYDDMDDDDELIWLMQQQGFVFRIIPDDDDFANFYNGDDSDVIWPPKPRKKGKKRSAQDIYDEFWNRESRKSKRKHRKGKRARLVDLNQPFSGEEEDPNIEYTEYEELGDDNGLMDGKEIYYYPDYHEKDSRLEFSTLKAFNEFCEDNGYTVPEHVANAIMYRRVSHTCLSPDAREWGHYEIMAEESYGGMFYEVCDSRELEM